MLIAIAITWLILFAAFVGLGLALLKVTGSIDTVDSEQLFNSFWLGWCLVLLMLQIWHLLFPVDFLPICLVLLLGAAGLWFGKTELALFVRRTKLKPLWVFLLVVSLLALANLASAPIRAYDAGLYHISAVRWSSAYPIVPGLANLHDRLGFNSSYFLYQAMLDTGFWAQRSYHVASGLLLMVVVLEIAATLRKIFNGEALEFFDQMRIVLLATVADQCFAQASTTSPDLAMHLIGIVLSVRLCRLIFSHRGPNRELADTTIILFLSAIGATVKLSFVVMGGLASAVVIVRAFYRGRLDPSRSTYLRAWAVSLAVVFLIIMPWMARNVMISGYPIYPIPLAPFDVEWRVPSETIANLNNWIKSWPRNPTALPKDVLGNWDWLSGWIAAISQNHKFNFILPLALFIIGNLVLLLSSQKRSFSFASWALFFGPGLVMVAFWFLSAPDPRYAGATFWCLGAGAVSLACGRGA